MSTRQTPGGSLGHVGGLWSRKRSRSAVSSYVPAVRARLPHLPARYCIRARRKAGPERYTYSLLDPPHTIPFPLWPFLPFFPSLRLKLLRFRKEQQDGLYGLRDEGQKVLIERKEVLEGERRVGQTERVCPLCRQRACIRSGGRDSNKLVSSAQADRAVWPCPRGREVVDTHMECGSSAIPH